MIESVKYFATMIAFIAISFVPSWCCVFSFWYGARTFHSVTIIRLGDAIGTVVLFPARTLLQFSGGIFDQMTLFTDPNLYAAINAALVGIPAYALCRRWIFDRKSGG